MSDTAAAGRLVFSTRRASSGTQRGPSIPESLAVPAAFFAFFAAWAIHAGIASADKSLHHDVLEAYAWGKEFQLGYHQHGPFWAWIAGAWFLIFPKTNASFVALEALNATIGLWGCWRLIGLFTGGPVRYAATLLLVATPFYTFLAYKFNANTIFISLWPWTLYFFIKSLDDLRLRDALLSGIFIAACLLSKYYAVIFVLTCALALPFHPNGRKYLLSPLPWAAGVACILFVLPHILWLLSAGPQPVDYAISLTGKSVTIVLGYAALFLCAVPAYHCVVAGALFQVWWASKTAAGTRQHLLPHWKQRFLAVLVLAPLLLTALFCLTLRCYTSPVMAVGAFPLMPLFLMQVLPRLDSSACFKLSAALAGALSFGAALASPAERVLTDLFSKDAVLLEPREELAEEVTALWHRAMHTPLRYAGAPVRYANAISFYSEDHPSSFAGLEYSRGLWVTPEKLKREGLLIACPHDDKQCLDSAQHFLTSRWTQTSIIIGRDLMLRHVPTAAFEIFMIPPKDRLEADVIP